MPDYIPRSDAEFDLWHKSFDKYLKNNLAALGLTNTVTTQLSPLQTAWEINLSEFLAAQAAAEAATQAKDAARAALEAYLRILVRQLQSNPATTDAQRAGLGVTVPDDIRTPVPVPTAIPFGNIDTSKRLEHTINFRNSETPTSTAKPEGVHGCQIWLNIGTQPPTSLDQFKFIATDTRTPYVLQFEMADAGKNAYYILRWVNTKDQPGPWSETLVATITG